MATYPSKSLSIESTGAANVLPDPAGLNGRVHDLVNGFTATTVWSSTGATPFTEDGVNATPPYAVTGSTVTWLAP